MASASVKPSEADMKRLRRAEQLPLAGTWIADHGLRRVTWSPAVFTICGVSPEHFDPTFENVLEMLVAEDQRHLVAQARLWATHPGPFGGAYRLRRADGEIRLLEVHGWVETEGDRMLRSMGMVRDVTEEFVVTREHERLARQRSVILHASGEGICGLDAGGRLTFVNPAMRRLLRREREVLEGRTLHELVHVDGDGGESHPADQCSYAGGSTSVLNAGDRKFQRADGTQIEVAYTLQPVDDDEHPGVVAAFRDVTPRRAAARLLQTSLRQVQMLSAQRSALVANVAEAEERERLRIAADIHDDPVQALSAVGLRLARAATQAADDPAAELLVDAGEAVRDVADQLRRLMFELLPPELGDDLRVALESYAHTLLADSPMTAEVVGDVAGIVPERRLLAYRLVQEAMRNAVKHSQGSLMRIELSADHHELTARVSDDGVGIDAGSPAAHPAHAGLGIIRRRAEAVGGRIGVSPGLNGTGTAVELRLPLRRERG